jgi:hypothetical protein
MRRNTYPKVVLRLLSILLVVLLAACGTVPTDTPLSAASSSPTEFRLRGMTSTIAYPDGYLYDAMIFAEYSVEGDLKGEKILLVITGPAEWNNGQPYEILAEAKPENALIQWGNRWKLSFSPEIATVPGVYTATTTISGKTYTSTLDVSMAQMLPSPADFTSSATAEKVDVSWQAVPGAKEYYVALYDELGEVWYEAFTTQTSVSFSDFAMPLDETKNYSVSLNALSEMQSTYFPENGDEMPVNYSVSYDVLENILGS